MAKHKWSKWTPLLIQQFSVDYTTCDWDTLLSKYPFTKSSLMTKASELGIRRGVSKVRRYSEEDCNIIKTLYENGKSDEYIANLLNRTTQAITTKREKLGLVERKCWSEKEDNILRSVYDKLPAKEIANMLPNRSRDAIVLHAAVLGLSGYKPYKEYSLEDEQFITQNYLTMSDDEMAKILGHPRASIKNRRNKLGLHRPKTETKYDDVVSYFRKYNMDWKNRSMHNCKFKCVVSGDRFDDIHHLTSLSSIVQDALTQSGISLESFDINKATENEKRHVVSLIKEQQAKFGLGICLRKDIHMQFHNIYGYGHNTPEQFEEFIKKYYPTTNTQLSL